MATSLPTVTMFTLRDYQTRTLSSVLQFARSTTAEGRMLRASPTGTGKTYTMLAAQEQLPDWWIVSPSLDILAGFLAKKGEQPADTDEALAAQCWSHKMTTPLRLLNFLMAGNQHNIAGTIRDEVHHDTSDTGNALDALLAKPAVGWTATPFRGTPNGTLAFVTKWGMPHWDIEWPAAVAGGYITMPECETWPLIDDDLIEISNGELILSQVTGATKNKMDNILDRCTTRGFFDGITPTVFSLPNTETAEDMQRRCMERGLATCMVTQGTPRVIRNEILRRAVSGTHALINVRVIGEGVDVPFRRYIDLSPTLSPVLWLQRFGRTTRPGGSAQYICCNRNLMRHFYLLAGAMPPSFLRDSVSQFGGLTKRAGHRAFGLEGIGRLQPSEIPLTNGLSIHVYQVNQMVGATDRVQYTVIVHPELQQPIWATRTNSVIGTSAVRINGRDINMPVLDYGRWSKCNPPNDLQGFRSIPNRGISPAQANWWQRDAHRYGIALEEPTAKTFQILPVLKDLGAKLA